MVWKCGPAQPAPGAKRIVWRESGHCAWVVCGGDALAAAGGTGAALLAGERDAVRRRDHRRTGFAGGDQFHDPGRGRRGVRRIGSGQDRIRIERCRLGRQRRRANYLRPRAQRLELRVSGREVGSQRGHLTTLLPPQPAHGGGATDRDERQ